MIRDAGVKSEIEQDWRAVKKLCKPGDTYFLSGFGVVNESHPDDFYNLPLVLAYSVLDQVLTELRDQGEYTGGSRFLGSKMDASKCVLPWQDYSLVEEGKEARNNLAHEALLASKADCLRYIDAIEAELMAWAIL